MAESPLKDWRTQVLTTDGLLWSAKQTAEQITYWLHKLETDGAGDEVGVTLPVRGPLYPQGWQAGEWQIPAWAILAFRDRP